MKKVYKLQELDCAHCAAKMEQAIGEIPGVEKATVSFMSQRLTIEAEEALLEGILTEAQRRIKKIEPHCILVK